MKARGGSKIVEKNNNRKGTKNSRERMHVEYSTIGYKVVATFIIIFGMCKREGVK
jgi:hypothetical protein